MNEELQKQLAEYLRVLVEATKGGADFVIEQAPLVVQEKILYGRVGSLVGIIMCVIVIAIGARWVTEFANMVKEGDKDFNGAYIFGGMGGVVIAGIGSVVAGVMLIVSMDTALKAWLAPRLYVLEWILEMVK